MNVKQFVELVGWAEAERVAIAAGTNRAYLSQLAGGHRNPSTDMALRLVKASDGRMDLVALLTANRQSGDAA